MERLVGSGTAALIGVRSVLRTSAAPPVAQGEPVGTGVADLPGCENVECPQGRIVDPDTCNCVCDVDCPPNRAPDPNTCTCYCTLSDSYVCPREDQVYDDSACLCVCANEDCPGDAVLDPESCLCFCPDTIQCAGNETIDPTTCECVCNLECDQPGKTLDPGDCLCVCIDDNCPGDAVFDPDTCTCSCPPNLVCAEGEGLDPTTCECVCNRTCDQSGYVLDKDTCQCVCEVTACSAPHTFDAEVCACVCPPVSGCPANKVQDPESCECICPPGDACPATTVQDPESCECICPPNIACRQDQMLDPVDCTCICPPGTTVCNDLCIGPCLPTETLDDTCRCVQIICPPDRVLTCTCACPPGMAECKDSCLPACRPNQVFDDACRCVCRPCAEGRVVDPETCECICPGSKPCTTGHKIDPKTCECVCDAPACPPGRVFDKRCNCVCPADIPCRDKKNIDPKTCKCICPKGPKCRADEIADPETCACVCKPGSVLETITVPCNGKSVKSKTTLTAGKHYILRASGTCTIGPSTDASPIDGSDAEYAFLPSDPNDLTSVVDRCGSAGANIEFGIGVDDATIDSTKTPHWGAYNPSHVYTIDFIGKGAPISLNFHDCVYRDNNGSLQVEIICSDPNGRCCSGSATCDNYTSASLCCLAPQTAFCCCDSTPGAGDGLVTCCTVGVDCPVCPSDSWAYGGVTEICSEPGGNSSAGCPR